MKITVRDREFEVELPALDLREELVHSYGEKHARRGIPFVRTCAAMIGLCLPEVMFSLRLTTNGARADLAEWGGKIYIALREKGWTAADMAAAAGQILGPLMAETFPRESEVVEARGN